MLKLCAAASAGSIAAPLAAHAVPAPRINRGRFRLFPDSPQQYSAKAIELMGRSVVIDMLSPLVISPSKMRAMAAKPEDFSAAELDRFRSSGINVFHVAIGIGGQDAYTNVLRYVAGYNGFIATNDAGFLRIDNVTDMERAKQSGKIGVLIGLQDSSHFNRLDDVNFFHSMGQRVSQLTYNSRNLIGNGSTERRDDGLSDFGIAIVDRMNQVGMAVDVSHCGDRTSLDACEVSKKPVLITHSNCRALVPHPRCKTDEAIRAMAKSGGVMGITGVRMFVRDREPTTIEHMLDHFDHVAKLVGVEHLGVGSDMDLDGYDDLPEAENKQLRAAYKDSYAFRERLDIEGVDHPKRMFDLTEGLLRRKYSDAHIAAILGGNFQRVLGQIWSVS
jgi:membrane dipeptidase